MGVDITPTSESEVYVTLHCAGFCALYQVGPKCPLIKMRLLFLEALTLL